MNRKINIIFHVNVNCRVDGKKCNSNHWWNNNKCQCVSVKKLMYVKKNMFGILVNVFVKIENI